MSDGRFAPSPSGPLHVGNLRTALIGWLRARQHGSRHLLRIEDLDPVASRDDLVIEHQRDLELLGVDWDGPVLRQSERSDRYDDVLATLAGHELVYPCFCTRREVLDAATAPHDHLPDGAYPGTCASLDTPGRAARIAAGRRPAWRVRAGAAEATVVDHLNGRFTETVDDFVVRRRDGVAAYNLAVVVDDWHQGVEEVVRGADLLPGTPRQAWLADLIGAPRPRWLHVPLVVGPDGERLAKRHGSVTLGDLANRWGLESGTAAARLRGLLAASLGVDTDREPKASEVLEGFAAAGGVDGIPRVPFVFLPPEEERVGGGQESYGT